MALISSNTETKARQDLLAAMMRLVLNTTSANAGQALATALRKIAHYHGAERVFVFHARPDGAFQLTEEWARQDVARLDPSDAILPATALNRWKVALTGGFSVDLPAGTQFPQTPAGSTVLVPINAERGLTGIIGIETQGRFMLNSEKERQFLGVAADLIQTIVNARTASGTPENPGARPAGPGPATPDQEPAVAGSRDAAFDIDAEGLLHRLASPALWLKGAPEKARLWSAIEDVFPDEIAQDIRSFLQEVHATGTIINRPVEVKTPGQSVWYDLTAHALPQQTSDAATCYRFKFRDTEGQADHSDETVHLGRIVEMMTNLVEIVDTEQRIVWTNRAFQAQTGHSLNESRGLHLCDLLTGDATNRETVEAVRQAMAEGRGFEGENINYNKDGSHYWVTFNMQPLKDATGQIAGYVFVETVITKSRELELALRAERDFLGTLTENSVSAVVACDLNGNCVFANSEARHLLQRQTDQSFPHASAWPLTSLYDTDGQEKTSPFRQVMETGTEIRAMALALTHPGEPRRVLSVNAAPLGGAPTKARVIVTLTDITAQFEAEELTRQSTLQALRAAEHEPVTGLPSRTYLTHRLDAAIKAGPQPGRKLYVIAIDLDRFKTIKTVLGHDIGDKLLRAVGLRLSEVAGPTVTLSCIGGDCFVAFTTADRSEIEDLLIRLRKAVAKPYDLEQTNIFITPSIGVTSCESVDDTSQTLLRQAEMASYSAKTRGGNRHAYHSKEMGTRFSRRSNIVQALRQALQSDEFELAFQPKFSLTGGCDHIGAEALLRWNSPALGPIGPAEFIPVAEAAGVISEIDFHVIGIFTRQLGKWQRAGTPVPASINLSPLSFENPTLAPHLLARLAEEKVPYENVTIEITETSLVSASRNAVRNISQFRSAGISLSIDDFGTGYSSLSYLQRLIVSEVKIDKSFIQTIGTCKEADNSEVIVRTILKLAKSFGLRTVAEGVESMEQLNWLRQAGCDAIQGYLGGKAASPEVYAATVVPCGTLFEKLRKQSA